MKDPYSHRFHHYHQRRCWTSIWIQSVLLLLVLLSSSSTTIFPGGAVVVVVVALTPKFAKTMISTIHIQSEMEFQPLFFGQTSTYTNKNTNKNTMSTAKRKNMFVPNDNIHNHTTVTTTTTTTSMKAPPTPRPLITEMKNAFGRLNYYPRDSSLSYSSSSLQHHQQQKVLKLNITGPTSLQVVESQQQQQQQSSSSSSSIFSDTNALKLGWDTLGNSCLLNLEASVMTRNHVIRVNKKIPFPPTKASYSYHDDNNDDSDNNNNNKQRMIDIRYLRPSSIINHHHQSNSDILRLARSLTDDTDDWYKAVFTLANWVATNIEYRQQPQQQHFQQQQHDGFYQNLQRNMKKKYGIIETDYNNNNDSDYNNNNNNNNNGENDQSSLFPAPASHILECRYGTNSAEITSLFISLNRAVGIPARLVHGYAYKNSKNNVDNKMENDAKSNMNKDKDSLQNVNENNTSNRNDDDNNNNNKNNNNDNGEEWVSHTWAEVWFPNNIGWVPFDITFREFGFLNCGHVMMCVTDDAIIPTSTISKEQSSSSSSPLPLRAFSYNHNHMPTTTKAPSSWLSSFLEYNSYYNNDYRLVITKPLCTKVTSIDITPFDDEQQKQQTQQQLDPKRNKQNDKGGREEEEIEEIVEMSLRFQDQHFTTTAIGLGSTIVLYATIKNHNKHYVSAKLDIQINNNDNSNCVVIFPEDVPKRQQQQQRQQQQRQQQPRQNTKHPSISSINILLNPREIRYIPFQLQIRSNNDNDLLTKQSNQQQQQNQQQQNEYLVTIHSRFGNKEAEIPIMVHNSHGKRIQQTISKQTLDPNDYPTHMDQPISLKPTFGKFL